MIFSFEEMYSCNNVILSIEFSKFLLLTYFSNSLLFSKYFTPNPLPPLLCLVINGLLNSFDLSINSFLFFVDKVFGNFILNFFNSLYCSIY